jgi:type II secretory pathway pseudopilin PulG
MKLKISILAAIFLASLILAPANSSAQTAADFQAIIQNLLSQIRNLQSRLAEIKSQPVSAKPVGSKWCYDFKNNLKIGSTGSDVSALQKALSKEGFKVEATGYFGEKTASAVTGFQQKYQKEILAPWKLKYGTGFVGKTTREKLNSLYGCGGVIPRPAEKKVVLLSPKDEDTILLGDTVEIRWKTIGIETKTVKLRFSDTHGFGRVIETENDGNYIWKIEDDRYRESLRALRTLQVCAESWCSNMVRFRIKIAKHIVTSPNGGDVWEKGTSERIQWQTISHSSYYSKEHAISVQFHEIINSIAGLVP